MISIAKATRFYSRGFYHIDYCWCYIFIAHLLSFYPNNEYALRKCNRCIASVSNARIPKRYFPKHLMPLQSLFAVCLKDSNIALSTVIPLSAYAV